MMVLSPLLVMLTYICVAGFVWAMTPESWNNIDNAPAKQLATICWPIFLAGYMVYGIAMIGPATVTWYRERNRLPKAQVVRK